MSETAVLSMPSFLQVFNYFDTDKDGLLDVETAVKALRSSGLIVSLEDINKMQKEYCDKAERINSEAFLKVVGELEANAGEKEKRLREALRVFQKDNDGIDVAGLKHALCTLCDTISENEAADVFDNLRTDENGLCPIDDLVNVLMCRRKS